MFLLVTLEKNHLHDNFKYGDRFLTSNVFEWQSQNRTSQGSKHGQLIKDHVAAGVTAHLFVRREKKRGASAAPFVYCGPVTFQDWEGDMPITVRWRLSTALPSALVTQFTIESDGAGKGQS
jgi:hypothetical protein